MKVTVKQIFKSILVVAVSLFIYGILLAINGEAHAQQNKCYPSEKVVEGLAKSHGEHRSYIAIVKFGGKDTVIHIFVSEESGSWTMFVENPDNGLYCPLYGGYEWTKYNGPKYVEEFDS